MYKLFYDVSSSVSDFNTILCQLTFYFWMLLVLPANFPHAKKESTNRLRKGCTGMLLVHGTHFDATQHVHSRCHIFEAAPGECNKPLHTTWNTLYTLLARLLLESVRRCDLRPKPRDMLLARLTVACGWYPFSSWNEVVNEVAETVFCWGASLQTWLCTSCKDAWGFCILEI